MLYLTRDESNKQKRRDDDPQLGMVITFPNQVKHFIPGSTVEFAWVLAENSPAVQWLNHPQTRIEYGERCRGVFTVQKTLKIPTGETK